MSAESSATSTRSAPTSKGGPGTSVSFPTLAELALATGSLTVTAIAASGVAGGYRNKETKP